jgi:hypothetical protein
MVGMLRFALADLVRASFGLQPARWCLVAIKRKSMDQTGVRAGARIQRQPELVSKAGAENYNPLPETTGDLMREFYGERN